MSEDLIITNNLTKAEKYEELLPQLEALIATEDDLIANLANIAAALREYFGWWWVGFYLVKSNQLVLGPFQGPVACTRIQYGKGVCGTAWKNAESILVPDVNNFPGHIACSSLSVAEVVVPIFNANNEVMGVIDVDSEAFGILDEIDVQYLEEIGRKIRFAPPPPKGGEREDE